ncbi:DUF2345 domain-containing protein, partial [Chitinolyticbacter albus]|uniref:DUF2345 domain-containing protein n=1 Tax=Chitinolyticbacter albus TaxID=2961951 RepID=UPI0021090959
ELILNAGHNLDLVSQRDTQQTTARRWVHNVGSKISLFVQGVADKVNLKLIAAKGHVNVQAQSGDVEIVGDKNLRIFANKEKLIAAAKEELLLTCGGANIRLKGGNIEIHAPGSVSFKGSDFNFSGPASMKAAMPFMPQPENHQNWIELNYAYDDIEPVKGAPFTLKYSDGTEIRGKLDDKGFARVDGVPLGTAKVLLGDDSRAWDPKRKIDNPHAGSASDADSALSFVKKLLLK